MPAGFSYHALLTAMFNWLDSSLCSNTTHSSTKFFAVPINTPHIRLTILWKTVLSVITLCQKNCSLHDRLLSEKPFSPRPPSEKPSSQWTPSVWKTVLSMNTLCRKTICLNNRPLSDRPVWKTVLSMTALCLKTVLSTTALRLNNRPLSDRPLSEKPFKPVKVSTHCYSENDGFCA